MEERPSAASASVAAQMSRMPRAHSRPEVSLRRELHRRGLRFSLHGRLPGRPDIVLTRAKLAIFVDGCFWHMCPEHGVLPKNNHDWWLSKLQRNVERDREKDSALQAMGWVPLHVWEHEALTPAGDRVEDEWRRLTGRPHRQCGGGM